MLERAADKAPDVEVALSIEKLPARSLLIPPRPQTLRLSDLGETRRAVEAGLVTLLPAPESVPAGFANRKADRTKHAHARASPRARVQRRVITANILRPRIAIAKTPYRE
jgi:hypothetical protein